MKNKTHKTKQCEFKDFKNKLCEKQLKIIEHLQHQKILFFCVSIKWTHLFYSLQTHREKIVLK